MRCAKKKRLNAPHAVSGLHAHMLTLGAALLQIGEIQDMIKLLPVLKVYAAL